MHAVHRTFLTFIVSALMPTLTLAAPATTQATTQLTSGITPQAAAVIADVKQAYTDLKSLDLAGKITGDFDVDGQKENPSIEFTTNFSAPNLFRLDTKDDGLIGNNGTQLFIYAKDRNIYRSVDSPKSKMLNDALPNPLGDLISQQNPSLMLALSSDPAAEFSNDYGKVEKLDDIKLDDRAFTALKLQRTDHQSFTTLLIDPKTNLLRRAMIDISTHLAARGAGDIKKAVITIDYTIVTPNATTRPTEFAWAPPPGARDAAGISAGDDVAAQLIGKPAPAFTLKDLDDKDVSLASLKGKVVVLDFWATWCPACVQEMPDLDKVYQEFKDQGVQIYAVNQGEDKELAGGFMQSRNLSIPVLLDTDTKVGIQYGADQGIPETLVIGRDGTVLKSIEPGPDAASDLRDAIKSALKPKKPNPAGNAEK